MSRSRGSLLLLLLWIGASASAERPSGAPEDWPEPMPGPAFRTYLLADRLEHRVNDGDDLFHWDVEGWLGGDLHKLWFESSGDSRTSGPWGGELELQLMYGRTISPFFDLRTGVRQDVIFGVGPDEERTFASLGVQGSAPFGVDLHPMLFVSDEGDVSLRLSASHEQQVTRRIVAQTFLELELAADDARTFGVRRGFSDVELGLRVRWEIRPELAPYVGVNWLRKLGTSADLARDEGEDAGVPGFVAGLRLWF